MKRLLVAAVQMKFRPTIRENVERIVDWIDVAKGKGVDAILFPECAVTGYRPEFKEIDPGVVEDGCKKVARAAKMARCNVLVGSPTFRQGKWFNSLLVFNRQGREVFRYSKIHLTRL